MLENKVTQPQGMLVIVDRRNLKGLAHWIDELVRRDIPAVIQVGEHTITEYCHALKEFPSGRFEFGGAYNERPFWDESFARQYEIMKGVKEKLEACFNKPKYNSKMEASLKSKNPPRTQRLIWPYTRQKLVDKP